MSTRNVHELIIVHDVYELLLLLQQSIDYRHALKRHRKERYPDSSAG